MGGRSSESGHDAKKVLQTLFPSISSPRINTHRKGFWPMYVVTRVQGESTVQPISDERINLREVSFEI
jgi:hypothetical protein